MSLWHRLLSRLGLFPDSVPHYYELDETLYTALVDLAEREQRPTDEIVSEFVAKGLNHRYSQEDTFLLWESLSPREKQVTALAYLGYTNRQIAVRLGISDETIKTHLHNALVKLNIHSRSEMRMLLSEWDLSSWDRQ
jgi:DNA-binding NarL/FixJ family response regulator